MTTITKGEIDRVGGRLVEESPNEGDNSVLEYFRSIHQHPMALFRHTIDRKLKKHTVEALVSQRLKRRPSIIRKLKIQKNMNLSRMQDIGGLRIVVKTIQEVDLIRDKIRKVEQHRSFKFIFSNEKDYIKNPKDSGYRSIHMVYKYEKYITPKPQTTF